jgi:hypothetical protein
MLFLDAMARRVNSAAKELFDLGSRLPLCFAVAEPITLSLGAPNLFWGRMQPV